MPNNNSILETVPGSVSLRQAAARSVCTWQMWWLQLLLSKVLFVKLAGISIPPTNSCKICLYMVDVMATIVALQGTFHQACWDQYPSDKQLQDLFVHGRCDGYNCCSPRYFLHARVVGLAMLDYFMLCVWSVVGAPPPIYKLLYHRFTKLANFHQACHHYLNLSLWIFLHTVRWMSLARADCWNGR